jgi:hypothetical protein
MAEGELDGSLLPPPPQPLKKTQTKKTLIQTSFFMVN